MAMTHAVLNVPAISCGHCKAAIETALKDIAGLDGVDVDVAAKTVTVDYEAETTPLETIAAAISAAGYEVAGQHVFGV